MNSFDVIKKKKNSNKAKEVISKAIAAMEELAASSDYNFTNKLRLLEAERVSLRENHFKAMQLYDDSIASAKESGFIHEQGLAYERAGFYLLRKNQKEKALEYFKRARECYEEWGSNVRVDVILKELNTIMSLTNN